MGNASQKQSLYDAINANDCDTVLKLLAEADARFLNEPISEDNLTTPLGRAAWRGNVEMIYTLLEKGADVNYTGPQEISPLQWAAQRGKDEAVDFLAQKGADLNYMSKDKLNALDYAILYGAYNCARKLKNLGLAPKEVEFYQETAKQRAILYYDYPNMLDHLERGVALEECPPFNIAPEGPKMQDPVIDPRETWTQFFKRVSEFEEPPLVERSELPPELRPENRALGKLRNLINGINPFPEEERVRRSETRNIDHIDHEIPQDQEAAKENVKPEKDEEGRASLTDENSRAGEDKITNRRLSNPEENGENNKENALEEQEQEIPARKIVSINPTQVEVQVKADHE